MTLDTVDFSEDLLNIKPKTIEIDNIYIDPNNPRFLIYSDELVPENRIIEDAIQREAQNKVIQMGIIDISEKIKKVGFLKIDRIVVRLLSKNTYIVIEGNRRITAIKTLLEDHKKGRVNLSDDILKSMKEIEVLIYEGDDEDISWLIQGLRHITGIKDWVPIQQAKFLVDMQEKRNFSTNDLNNLVGLGRSIIVKLTRSYYGWIQAKEDEEYGDYITPNHFGLFNDAIFKKTIIMKWLNWNDREKKFKNIFNFRKLIELYVGFQDENGVLEEPRIKRVIDVRDVLSALLIDNNKSILQEFENGELTIDKARVKISEEKSSQETKRIRVDLDSQHEFLEEALITVQTLPTTIIALNKDKILVFIELLTKIITFAEKQKEILEHES